MPDWTMGDLARQDLYDPLSGLPLTPDPYADIPLPSYPPVPRVMERDLTQQQMNVTDIPEGYSLVDGKILNSLTGEELKVTPRPAVLPFTRDPNTGEVVAAMPKMLDILGNLGGGGPGPAGALSAGVKISRAEKPIAAPSIIRATDMPPAMPQVAERYPRVGPPEWRTDPKSGEPYQGKLLTPEGERVAAARRAAQQDIEKGNYEPYFDVGKRGDVDVSKYAPQDSVYDVLKKKPDTITKFEAIARDPGAYARLNEAFDRGMKQEGLAGNWYYMKQLEQEYIREYGAKLGRELFQERFGHAMAATTGGADPTSNLMMAHYGNFLKTHDKNVPKASHQYPFPIGGRYAANNMAQFQKMVLDEQGIAADVNPKRYAFSGNFTGGKQPTIDEQMSALFVPGMQMPPTGSYGHFAGALRDLAEKRGYDPRFFQEVAWAGRKDATTKGGYRAKPMIEHVNEAIERTHRITGMDHDEIVRRGLVRGEIPIYGFGFQPGAMGELARQDAYQ